MGEHSWDRPFTIAMLAVGGQGGGVLTGWLVDIAEANGFLVQSTYVAGVAQRTGATVYCVELMPREETERRGKPPVFSLYPVPGDVDLVITSELAESARAIEKGFVTPNLTTLVTSSHRIYTIGERTAMGDAIADSNALFDAAQRAAREFVCFDMQAAADRSGSVISSVILGAIAGTGLMPFEREAFEAAIRRSGRAVEANLAGFDAGFEGARSEPLRAAPAAEVAEPFVRGPGGEALRARIADALPAPVREIALHGALRALEYQDADYAGEYLDRLEACHRSCAEHAESNELVELVGAVARQLALQMCYEDTIRVAQIKTRGDRLEGIRRDVAAGDGQPFYVTEYFHPRYEEFCDTLPAGLGRRFQESPFWQRAFSPFFGKGRNLSTNKVWGFLFLRTLAGFRRWRRGTLRYSIQQRRIEKWLALIDEALRIDPAYALAVADAMKIVKGYGETYERGLERYEATIAAAGANREAVDRLIAAAQADEEGEAFEAELGRARGAA